MANDTEQRVSTLEATLQEFISQSARLLGDHGSRLSRTEAQIESLVSLFQAADRRLNRLEAWADAFDQRMLQLESVTLANSESIGHNTSDLRALRAIVQANEQRLLALTERNEERFRQLALSQEQVLSRMDDLIAVVRERL